jgi:NADPH2:quinone reductase
MTPGHSLQLVSHLKADGELELSFLEVATPRPGPNEVVVRVDAAPINPSDLWLLLAGADLDTAQVRGTAERPAIAMRVPARAMPGLAARVGQAMPVGNEGAGVVIDTGSSPAAQALRGKTVAAFGGGMFAQVRCVGVDACVALPDGTSAEAGAAAFVNPLTALCFLETMRHEGHRALVNTAAASNLGQMLVRLCATDGVPLVNIVRSAEQVQLLRALGASHVLDSSSPDFSRDLTEAVFATGATIAFDAIGGGKLVGQILACMEAAQGRTATGYSRYGSPVHKQVYIYGALDPRPTELTRNFGLAWGVGGWLVTPWMQKLGPEVGAALRARIGRELTTTFASQYAGRVTLAGALALDNLRAYAKRATGAKFLIEPNAK